MQMRKTDVGKLARIGMMGAISAVLGFFPEIPMVFFAPFLKLDFSYVPMLLTGYALGFGPGLITLVIKNVFQLLTSNSAGIGQLADMLIGIAMLLPAILIYSTQKSRKTALWGMLAGIVSMMLVGVLSNRYILLPFYYGDGLSGFLAKNPGFLWVAIAPFNLVKGAADCAVTYVLYKRLSPFLKRGLRG